MGRGRGPSFVPSSLAVRRQAGLPGLALPSMAQGERIGVGDRKIRVVSKHKISLEEARSGVWEGSFEVGGGVSWGFPRDYKTGMGGLCAPGTALSPGTPRPEMAVSREDLGPDPGPPSAEPWLCAWSLVSHCKGWVTFFLPALPSRGWVTSRPPGQPHVHLPCV